MLPKVNSVLRQAVQPVMVEKLEQRSYLSGVGFSFAGTTPIGFRTTLAEPPVVAADLTNNGRADFIAVNSNGVDPILGINAASISVLLSNSNGTFMPPEILSDGGTAQPLAVTVADLNGDGIPDIITVNHNYSNGEGSVSVFLGNGDGTFKPASYIGNVGYGVASVVVGNFTGHPDIVVPGILSGLVVMLPGNGDGTFGAPETIGNAGFVPVSMAVGDLNGDGHDDLVINDEVEGDVAIFLGEGNGQFQQGFAESDGNIAGRIIKIADVNGDNIPDIVVLGNLGVSVLLGVGNGTFKPAVTTSFTSSGSGFGIADINGDGIPDLVVAQNGGLSILLGNGNGTFAGPIGLSLAESNFVVADVNGDGKPDLVIDVGNAVESFLNAGGSGGSLLIAPTIARYGTAKFTVGQYYSYAVNAAGNPTPDLTEQGALPAGLSFVDNGNGTARIFGVPQPGTAGAYGPGFYELEVNANNGIYSSPTEKIDLVVNPIPTPPVLDNTQTILQFPVGEPQAYIVSASGYPPPILTEVGTLPSGVVFSQNPGGVGEFLGTPSNGTAGIYAVTVVATNGVSPSSSQVFTLAVGNQPFFASNDSAGFAIGLPGIFTIAAAGLPTPSITETGSLPSGIIFVDNGNGTAVLSGTPAAGTVGRYTLTFNAGNGNPPNASQAFTLTIGQAPSLTSNAAATFNAGAAGSFNVTTDGFPAAALTEVGNLPRGVNFIDNGDGTAFLTGSPTAGTEGSYTLTFDASNGVGAPATQSFDLTIQAPLSTQIFTAPQITSSNVAIFAADRPSLFTISTTASPTAGLSEIGALPGGLTFTDNGDGTATIDGTPSDDNAGNYELTIVAANGVSLMATQTLELAVEGPTFVGSLAPFSPSFTSSDAGTIAIGQNNQLVFSAIGLPTPSLTEIGTLPSGLSFTDNGNGTATLSGNPVPSEVGNYSLTLVAANGVGIDADQVFSLTISQALAPSFVGDNHATWMPQTFGSFTITTLGSPTPAITENGALPMGLTFVDNGNGTATISGTPDVATQGIYELAVSAANGVGSPATQTLTLTLDGTQPTFNLANHVLIVTGTPQRDVASITNIGGLLTVIIDSSQEMIDVDQVPLIEFFMLRGGDSVSIGAGVPPVLVEGNGGNDTIVDANNAGDILSGGAGDDSIQAGSGNNLLQGGAGNDTLTAGTGANTLLGNGGDDSLVGGTGHSLLEGGAGNNTLVGGNGSNTLLGGGGDDSLVGGGANLIYGGGGADTILHGANDTVISDAMDSLISI